MLNSWEFLYLSVWIIQGFAMLVDEFYFHHKRGLGKWESLGHPIDTLFFLFPFIYCLSFTLNKSSQTVFIILSALSCLIITKDEWIHAKQSDAKENWLHSIQFLIHPLSLFSLYFFWEIGRVDLIKIQTVIITIFMFYQIIYWNLLKKNKYEIRNK